MPRITAQGAAAGVFVAVGNLLIFQHFMGASVADVKHKSGPLDSDVEKMERQALYYSIGFTVLTSEIIGSVDTFLVAGTAIVMADFAYKHANAVNPHTGTMSSPNGAGGAIDGGGSPMPDYTGDAYASTGG